MINARNAFKKYLIEDCISHSTATIENIILEVDAFIDSEQGQKTFVKWMSMKRLQKTPQRGAKSMRDIYNTM